MRYEPTRSGSRAVRPGIRPGASLHELARDWITLWQSELAALAADREAQETWQALVALWAGAAACDAERERIGLRRGKADGAAPTHRAPCCAGARARCCCT